MMPVATTFFFYFLSGLALLGAVLTITRKNPIHSALSLILTLLALAGLYLMLYAPFVAGVQIILYAGGIMVLFLFVIMLVNIEKAELEERFNKQWLVGTLLSVGLGGLLLFIYKRGMGIFPATFQKIFSKLIVKTAAKSRRSVTRREGIRALDSEQQLRELSHAAAS